MAKFLETELKSELKRVPCKAKVRECTGEHLCCITPDIEMTLARVIEDVSRRWRTQGFPLTELIIKDEEEFLIFQSVRKEVAARKANLVKDMMKHIVGETLVESVVEDDLPLLEVDSKKKKSHKLRR
jgi:hypothetical protein